MPSRKVDKVPHWAGHTLSPTPQGCASNLFAAVARYDVVSIIGCAQMRRDDAAAPMIDMKSLCPPCPEGSLESPLDEFNDQVISLTSEAAERSVAHGRDWPPYAFLWSPYLKLKGRVSEVGFRPKFCIGIFPLGTSELGPFGFQGTPSSPGSPTHIALSRRERLKRDEAAATFSALVISVQFDCLSQRGG